jgi:hypothetical protein
MKKIYVLILFIVGIGLSSAKAQTDTIPLKRFNIAFSPLRMIYDGMQTDIEFRRKHKAHYIGLSPRFYFNSYRKEFFGVGSGLSYKIILDKKLDDNFSPYVMGTGEYTYYKFYGTNYPEADVKYYTNSFRLSAVTGFQLILADAFFFDAFVGYGFAYSVNSKDFSQNSGRMYDHQYSGIYIPFGFRLGITL